MSNNTLLFIYSFQRRFSFLRFPFPEALGTLFSPFLLFISLRKSFGRSSQRKDPRAIISQPTASGYASGQRRDRGRIGETDRQHWRRGRGNQRYAEKQRRERGTHSRFRGPILKQTQQRHNCNETSKDCFNQNGDSSEFLNFPFYNHVLSIDKRESDRYFWCEQYGSDRDELL